MSNGVSHSCIISLASNCCQEENLAEAQCRLSQILFSPSYTDAIWTEPINSHLSSRYLNQLVYAQTSLTVDALQAALKQLECEMGRTPDDRDKGIVRIDLDLLQFDSDRYHLRDWNRPYVQQLLH
jgi:2-amino-4-hydroxy-6-hydroxymethyldihydropteridine diphosphokinase